MAGDEHWAVRVAGSSRNPTIRTGLRFCMPQHGAFIKRQMIDDGAFFGGVDQMDLSIFALHQVGVRSGVAGLAD